jgi:hypothetical protein
MGIFIFKLVLEQVVFSLTFPWMAWFRNYRVLGRVAIFLAFQFKVFGRGRAKLCEKTALVALQAGAFVKRATWELCVDASCVGKGYCLRRIASFL